MIGRTLNEDRCAYVNGPLKPHTAQSDLSVVESLIAPSLACSAKKGFILGSWQRKVLILFFEKHSQHRKTRNEVKLNVKVLVRISTPLETGHHSQSLTFLYSYIQGFYNRTDIACGGRHQIHRPMGNKSTQ